MQTGFSDVANTCDILLFICGVRYGFWFGLFMTASVSMVIFNKLVMHTFPYPNTLLIIQNTITILLNVGGTQLGALTPFPHSELS